MKQWQIHAYKHRIKNKNPNILARYHIEDYVEVSVEADNEQEALAKAKDIIKRKYYRVFKVWDKPDEGLIEEMHMKSLELQAELIKTLKGK